MGPDAVSADEVEIVQGVRSRGRDPSVVALAIGDTGLCSGALISPRLVLTARHCVSNTVTEVGCPARGAQVLGNREPESLAVLVGDDVASAKVVARGLEILVPPGATLCDADIALLVLDAPVDELKPLPVRSNGVTKGERLRAVGYGKNGDGDLAHAGVKLVREHVQVREVTATEFVVGEATCQGDSGGPAVDEDTGEIVGVVSRGGPSCDGPDTHNIYTRVDAFAKLFEEGFARAGDSGSDKRDTPDPSDAGASRTPSKPGKRGTKQKPPSDLGETCQKATDCAAGVCVTEGSRHYCSRPCGSGDRCPAHYHCKPVKGGHEACASAS